MHLSPLLTLRQKASASPALWVRRLLQQALAPLCALSLLACSSKGPSNPGEPLTPPSAPFALSPESLPWSAPLAPQPPPNSQIPPSSIPAPQTIPEALGGSGSVFPVGFEGIQFSWSAKDLIQHRPWVSNEGRLAPALSYIYREAAYDVGTGTGDHQWLIDNAIFGGAEYHFQRDIQGKPVGPLHKVIFLFETMLPEQATDKIREAAVSKWGSKGETLSDEFGLSYDRWKTPTAEVRLYYSPIGAIPEALEIINPAVPAM